MLSRRGSYPWRLVARQQQWCSSRNSVAAPPSPSLSPLFLLPCPSSSGGGGVLIIPSRGCSGTEIYSTTSKVGIWGRKGAGHPGYPKVIPDRVVGADLNLQERLDELFAEDKARRENRTDIGFPPDKKTAAQSRKVNMEFRKQQRSNPDLERASRLRTLKVSNDDVKEEYRNSDAVFKDIQVAGDLYGVYDDLFGPDVYFTPNVHLRIEYDFKDDLVTPVFRGNIIKPKEATAAPHVEFGSDPDSLWTLVLTNPDGHFTDENSEYLHWMVGNIKGSDLQTGDVLCDYLQPFPPKGTGYHRYVFVLYKQKSEMDFSSYRRSANTTNLEERTFNNRQFFTDNKDELTPAGLAFFQSDWDSTLKSFFHNTLNMKEPRYEYHFTRPYIRSWDRLFHKKMKTGFNTFLDQHRDPKDIQEELVRLKLKTSHPFQGDLEADIKWPNAHVINPALPQWKRREIERMRLRTGYFRDLDWKEMQRDPSDA